MVSTAVESLQSAKSLLLAKISGLEREVKQIDAVVTALESLEGGDGAVTTATAAVVAAPVVAGKRVISAATKAKMKQAQQSRWAKINAAKAGNVAPAVPGKPANKKRTMSAAARQAIGAAAAARWAKIRAAKAKAAKKK